ncbi:MAG: hypothetical protein JW769_03630 [Parachlamydiales bacterium]|nr:hypothetical protein [Parachlamydiales bacterium]
MLGLLRRYQRAFLIFITIVIIVSFSFFGIRGRGPRQEKPKDVLVGCDITGKKIYLSDVSLMRYFLNSDRFTPVVDRKLPNFFNEGIFYKTFIKSGIGEVLFVHYFDEIKETISSRIEAMKKAVFYQHPYDKNLSAIQLWKRFYPNIEENLAFLEKEMTPSMIYQLLSESYAASCSVPPDMMRRLALYEESQRKIPQDSHLRYVDFSLFGYKTFEDWFGEEFVDILAQYIMNGAKEALDKGYQVTREELEAYLHGQASHALKHFNIPGDHYQFLKDRIGLSEKSLFSVTEKILLFQKMMEDSAGHVFLDPATVVDISSPLHQMATVEYRKVPSFLQIDDFLSYAHLESYLAATTDSQTYNLLLPSTFLPEEKIAEHYPELIYQNYWVQITKTDIEEAALGIGEKQLWSWQIEPDHFALIQKKFPKAPLKGDSEEKRFLSLEQLPWNSRQEIDVFSRKEMIRASDLIREALSIKPKEKKSFSISLTQNGDQIEYLSDTLSLYSLIQQALDPATPREELENIKDKLSCYTQDNIHFYQIEILSKDPTLHRWTYKEAKQLNLLDHLMAKYLQEHCSKKEDIEEMAKKVFAPCLEMVQKDLLDHGGFIVQSHEKNIEKYRLFASLRLPDYGVMAPEWELSSNKEDILVSSAEEWKKTVLLEEGRQEVYHVSDQGLMEGMLIQQKQVDPEYVREQKEKALQLLRNEAMCKIAEDLYQKIKEAHAIKVPLEKR